MQNNQKVEGVRKMYEVNDYFTTLYERSEEAGDKTTTGALDKCRVIISNLMFFCPNLNIAIEIKNGEIIYFGVVLDDYNTAIESKEELFRIKP